jgi:C_GCAxxG_C_C family probable redox protein
MNRKETAINYFNNGFNCSQAVLISFKDKFDLDEKSLLQISSPFGAGMGRLQKTCGAVSGANMVLGLRFGKHVSDDKESGDKMYELVRVFDEEFINAHNSALCRNILNVDLMTEDGQAEFKDKEMKEKICNKCIETAVDILETMV